MTAFDRSDTAKTYQELPAEELALIAFADPDYLPEAKELAIAELDRRGLANSKDKLLRRARREIKARRRLRFESNAVVRENQNQLRGLFGMVAMIAVTWIFALLAPFVSLWQDWSFDWKSVLAAIVWIVLVIGAIREARRGRRLKLQLFLIWPGILFLVSLACRLVFI